MKKFNKILNFISKKEIEEIARETGFVERASPISGINMLLAFTAAIASGQEPSLATRATFLNTITKMSISSQAIDQRIDKTAVDFLSACLKRISCVAIRRQNIPDFLSCFSHIFITDSTSFVLDSSLKDIFRGYGSGSYADAAARIHLMYDYLSGEFTHYIDDARSSEHKMLENEVNNRVRSVEKDLYIQDLGYFKIDLFRKIHAQGSSFVSRLSYQVKLHALDQTVIDIKSIINRETHIDCQILMHGIPCRLVGKLLPNDVYNDRLIKARKKAKDDGETISAGYEHFLKWSFYITNLNESYTFDIIHTIYRLRWQIELIFKTWKSHLGMDQINSGRRERVLCQIIGRLIVAVMTASFAHDISDKYSFEMSYYKVVGHFAKIAFSWALSVVKNTQTIFWNDFYKTATRFCKKSNHKSKPSIEQRMASLVWA